MIDGGNEDVKIGVISRTVWIAHAQTLLAVFNLICVKLMRSSFILKRLPQLLHIAGKYNNKLLFMLV